MIKRIVLVALAMLLCSGVSYADHPLITDEAETLDRGEVEFELNGEMSFDHEDGAKERETEISGRMTYGLIDNLEMEIEVPYAWVRQEEDEISRAEGFGDIEFEFKWRFYDEDDLNLALKPSVSIPTGSAKKELGAGKISYGLMFLASKEFDNLDLAFHFNLGYMQNEVIDLGEEEGGEDRRGLWHVSLAAEKGIVRNLTAVANIGMERNPDRESDTPAAFILGGLIYNISKHVSVDFGIKGGITSPEPDVAYLAGMTWSLD